MNDVLIILIITIIAVIIVCGVIFGIFYRAISKQKYELACDTLEQIQEKTKVYLIPLVLDYIKNINIEEFLDEEDKEKSYYEIVEIIENFISVKCKEKIDSSLQEYTDNKMLYKYLMEITDESTSNEIITEVKGDSGYKDLITDIYNTCFEEAIEQIETEDVNLEKELAEYENAPIKEETQEQHNQSIEEYAKAHLNEKIKELNEVYDEVEEEPKLKNVVPVRDLRALTPLIDDEEIIPPTDEEPDVLEDDGTYEVVEYLDNINDKTLEATNIDIEE